MIRKVYGFSVALIVLGTIAALYGQHAIYRYPRLAFDPAQRPDSVMLNSGLLLEAKGAYLKEVFESRFRAYQPEAGLQVSSEGQSLKQIIRLENIHPDAIFMVTGESSAQLQERTHGLLREVEISGMSDNETLTLSWHFPEKLAYRFVAIGDTGGDKELSWGLRRANELKADFILHMGDAYYDQSEIEKIGIRMNEAKVPVYTANGNHDFLGPQGNAIESFLTNIGPLNAEFNLLGHCFINLDTGAYMYPAHKGERAGLLAAEVVNHRRAPSRCTDYIVFTHKPMVDNFEAEFQQRKHALHGYDARWIIGQLQQLGTVTILAGHIHADFEFEQDGFKTFVTGSGLAHADLTRGGHYAKVLVGEIRADLPLQTEWVFNQMPIEYHCSKKIYQLLKRDKSPQAQAVNDACGLEGTSIY
jgi:predicted phosphodiesterase